MKLLLVLLLLKHSKVALESNDFIPWYIYIHVLYTYHDIHIIIGFYDSAAVREMLKESAEMYKFDHPNVLTLTGVCLDGGPAPFIIMPFMTNGSLLSYLKKNRASLVVFSNDSEEEEVI